ncbi:MAG: hypothetical protein HUJ96_00435, partial [Marinilabiliaceae bacterium]|nr:hypothetical protein [Marinilabiliaceae bacterium]
MLKYLYSALFFISLVMSSTAQEVSYMEMIKMQGGAFQSLPDSVWKGRKASLVVSSALPYIKDEVDAVAAEAV